MQMPPASARSLLRRRVCTFEAYEAPPSVTAETPPLLSRPVSECGRCLGRECDPLGRGSVQAQDEDGGSSPERGESAGSRKSQRSCKGQRYQALLSEGVLPGAAKERKGGKRGEGEEEDAGREEGEEDGDRGRRKGCREEDGGGKASRKGR